MSIVKGCHHIALRACDFEKTVNFYKALGLTERVRWEGAVMLDMGDGSCIEIFAGGEDRERTDERFLHLAFKVDDVEAAYNAAISAGATDKSAPYEACPLTAVPPIKMLVAFVYGPDGELLEFFKEI
jgi:glyoxylase I family protein